ncbi:MAG: MBL fold metallo-hydrolase [Thermoprotei archaeon]
MELLRVSEHIRLLKLSTPQPYEAVNVYIVGEGDSLCLIDAGPAAEECFRQIEQALVEVGSSVGKLEAILLTHSHVDHAGLAGRIQKLNGCRVYVHPRDVEGVVDPVGKAAERFKGVVDELVEPEVKGLVQSALEVGARRLEAHFVNVEPTPLPLGSKLYGLQIIEAPGHTPGSSVYVSEVGLCGDTLLDTLTLLIEDLEAYFETLSRLGQLGVSSLWPGHGGALHPANKWIEAIRQKYTGRVEAVRRIIREPRTLYEATKLLYGGALVWDPTSVRGNLAFALLQTKTYLGYLLEKRLAEKSIRGGRTYYKAREP